MDMIKIPIPKIIAKNVEPLCLIQSFIIIPPDLETAVHHDF